MILSVVLNYNYEGIYENSFNRDNRLSPRVEHLFYCASPKAK